MAKERNLPSKSTLTTSDYIRVVGSDNASYKQGLTSVKTFFGAVWHSYTQTTKEALLAQIDDDMTASGQNAYFGYMTGTQATLLGLPNVSFYVIGGNNSTNYRYIRLIRADGTGEYILPKQNGTWASSAVTLPTRAEIDALNSNIPTVSSLGALDLNTLPTDKPMRIYIQSTGNNATVERHYPEAGIAGFLVQLRAGDWRLQVYFGYGVSKIYYRQWYDSYGTAPNWNTIS